MNIKKPNLFIVGFQKCASSTLFDILISHPEISGTHPKETYYLSDDLYDHYDYKNNIDNMSSSWDSFINQQSNVTIEASVCNFYQKNALKYIKSEEESKVIFILRDPVDRFISVYKYLYGKINGIPAHMSINDFFSNCKEAYFSSHLLKYAIEHGKYCQYINHWKKEIGNKRVYVLGMKGLTKNSDETVKNLFDFLSLPNNTLREIPHKNRSKTYTFPLIHGKLVTLFGGTLLSNKCTKLLYNKLFMGPIDEKLLQFNSHKQLQQIYAEEYKTYSHFF